MFPYPNTAIEDQMISDPGSKKKRRQKSAQVFHWFIEPAMHEMYVVQGYKYSIPRQWNITKEVKDNREI